MSDTPETDKAEYEVRLGRHRRMVVRPELARRLERQRNAYAETLRTIASANERSHHEAAFATLIRERHPELGDSGQQPPRAEKDA